MNNLKVEGVITLRSSLAHGAFEAGATVLPFRREPVLQRDEGGLPRLDPYAALVTDPVQRETLRQYAQRLLRVIWQSKSDVGWTYSQMGERVAVAVRMCATLADAFHEVIAKLGGGQSAVYYGDDAEFVANVLAAADANTLLALLREPGERLLLLARMQAESAARYEKRDLPRYDGQLSLLESSEPETPAPPAFRATAAPDIAMLPVYSGNALRNGAVRRNGARYLLDHFGWRVPLHSFRSLFVGGALLRTGERGTDIRQRRLFLDLMPLYGLLGGPFNRADMVEGSVKTGKGYPVVREAAPVLPMHLRREAEMIGMQSVVSTETYSRREDARLAAGRYLSGAAVIGGDGEASSGMVFEREVLIPNTRLYSRWLFFSPTPLQVGAWVSAWAHWATRPVLGGVSQVGHGLADVRYEADGEEFVRVEDGEATLSKAAQRLFDDYRRHLDERGDAIRALLEAVDADAPDEPAAQVDGDALQGEFETGEDDG